MSVRLTAGLKCSGVRPPALRVPSVPVPNLFGAAACPSFLYSELLPNESMEGHIEFGGIFEIGSEKGLHLVNHGLGHVDGELVFLDASFLSP